MKIYSPSSHGFYAPEFQSDYELAGTWPADGVEITDEEWQALLDGQSAGQIIKAGPKGIPMLVDAPPPAPLTAEPQAAQPVTVPKGELAALLHRLDTLEDNNKRTDKPV